MIHILRLLSFFFFALSTQIETCSSLSITVLSNGGPETLALCTAKRCAAADRNCVSFVTTAGECERQQRLLYGKSVRANDSNPVNLISSSEDIASALTDANSLIITAVDSPIDTKLLKPAFEYVSPDLLRRVVLLSRQDASNGGGGMFGGGGNFKAAEADFQALLSSRGIPLSIVRCGILKGGGAGFCNLGGRVEGFEDAEDLGLDRYFYDGDFDMKNAMVSMQHDRFVLGAKLISGDPNKLPNAFMKMAMKDAVEASDTDTNVCVAAVAAAACAEMIGVENEESHDFSLGCEKSEDMLTIEDMIANVRNLA